MADGDGEEELNGPAEAPARVLVVDDDFLARLLIGEALKPEGFRLTEADNGELALAAFAAKPFDLVLLDVVMPGLDGFATCSRLREMPGGKHASIVMVTALDDSFAIEQAYRVGATDFITKPINTYILIHRVRYILRASAAMRELAWRADFQRVLIETLPVPIVVEDARGRCVVRNPAFVALKGGAPADGPASGEPGCGVPKPVVGSAADTAEPWRQRAYEAEIPVAGNGPRSVLVHQAVFNPPETEEAGVISVVQDVTERKRYEENLRVADTVFQTAADAIMVTDATGVIKSVNPAFSAVTGYAPEEAIGSTPRLLKSGRHDGRFYAAFWRSLSETGRWSGELWQRRKSGDVYPVWETVAAVRSPEGRIVEYVAFFNDISARKRAEQEVFYRANYDLLTGLPNRGLLLERLEQAVKQARRYGGQMALMFVDLDRFKQVNDTLGHSLGDRLLCQAATRLEACVRETDTVARQGGDEFVLVLPNITGAEDAGIVAAKIIARLAEPFDLGGNLVRIGASVGVALYPSHGDNSEDLVRHADLAMYQAKLAGRNTYRMYEPAMTDELNRQLLLESDLRLALEREEFALHFQPILEVASGRLAGAEALLRWYHPQRGAVAPGEFLPLAEETGLIRDIGSWALEQACRTLVHWRDNGLEIPVALNLSNAQVLRGWSAEALRDLLAHHRLAPQALVFEIAEDVLLADGAHTRQWLESIRRLGVRLDLDDFGTGYSSLSCLKRFPIDRVKIDLSFVRDMERDPADRSLVEAILSLCRILQLDVVAEGVETREQFDLLRDLGCGCAQGFLFSPPVAADEFIEVARRLGAVRG